MKVPSLGVLASLLLLTLAAPVPGAAVKDPLLTERYLVGLDPGAPGVDALLDSTFPGASWLGGQVLAVIPAAGFITVETSHPASLLRAAALDDRIRYVEFDDPAALRVAATPNDPGLSEQYALDLIGAASAWDRSTGSTSVTLAVLDTGVDARHRDLGRLLPGKDFTGSGSMKDSCGHGTHVTGIAAATADNDVGIAGLAQVRVLPVKVMAPAASGCTGSLSTVAEGIVWATDQGARVLTLSLGCESCTSQAVVDAIAYATGKGVLVVAAAGNSGYCTSCVNFPATLESVLAVGCTTSSDAVCSYSSRGSQVDIAAPGDRIASTWPGDRYRLLSGTSMSAPHVAAAAALLMSYDAGLTGAEARTLLLETATDVAGAGRDTATGAGRLDVGAAMARLAGGGTANARPEATFTTVADGLTLRVDGRGSSDPDGSIASWRWDWGDGSSSTSGATATHAYPRAGTYSVTLTVTDGGGASTSTSRSVTVSLEGPLLVESFDDGSADGWRLSGLWRVGSECLAGRSAPTALHYNSASSCTYATGGRTSGAAEVTVDLTATANPKLSFWYQSQVERSNYAGYDAFRVQVSTDGGASWTTVWWRDCRHAATTAWTEAVVDLSGHATSATRIRFAFDSGDGHYNGYRGWSIDDVRIG